MMSAMTLAASVEIANNYPDQIRIISDYNRGKFQGFLYLLKGISGHKLLVQTSSRFESAQQAEEALHLVCRGCVEAIKKAMAEQWSNTVSE